MTAIDGPKHAGGRPTKYDSKYCDDLLEFFSVEPNREVEVHTTDRRSGREYVDHVLRANDLPTFERFAHNIGVHVDTLIEWSKRYPEFSEAYKRSKQLQKDIIITNAMQGLYNTTFSIFLSKNITDLRDRQEIEHSLPGGFFQQPKLTIEIVDGTEAKPEAE